VSDTPHPTTPLPPISKSGRLGFGALEHKPALAWCPGVPVEPVIPKMAEPEKAARDWRDTLFLPDTEFPMKAGLAEREPMILDRWRKGDLYAQLRVEGKGRPPFTLHDGPPYANGPIHLGTALNKILKDVVVRSHSMMGFDSNYVPGWDCHGLPIEWKIEEKYRARGQSKDSVPQSEFRAECRAFATEWIDLQRAEFKRLGVIGDWDNPYLTMAFKAEAMIVREFLKFAQSDLLYRGSKPVMWSCVEKTALAEAEVEYHEHRSTTIHVRFPVVSTTNIALAGADVVIWTTTPWTIPGNRAVAYGPDIAYGIYEITTLEDSATAKAGDKLVLADGLAETIAAAAKITLTRLSGAGELKGTILAHPFAGQGYDFPVPLIAGDHVTADTGTGFVHTAPGHGEEDWEIGQAYGIEVPQTVDEDGSYYPHVPLFAGRKVLNDDGKEGDANGAVIGALVRAGALLAKGRLVHSYPHSWRSKAPLIFRNTPQWFVAMDRPMANGKTLREVALASIDATGFVPETGRNRIRSMVAGRPDWVLSRQRAWGVPLTIFAKPDGTVLRDEAVNARIIAEVEVKGADAWTDADPRRFLNDEQRAQGWVPVTDILDVWFDSGCTHAFVLEERPDLNWPAQLYLEGSDQHRGWFQSSLLEGCFTRGRAPYDQLLTHGFIVDERGRKMSKSLGNTVEPQEIIAKNGADILRLWVAGSDFTEDLKMGPEILKTNADLYRKLRNTIRFTLANLKGFDPAERIDPALMPELDRYVLHRLAELDSTIRQAYMDYDFPRVVSAVVNFCASDLSAFYYDIRKDALYCDPVASVRRRAARTLMDLAFDALTAWLAPILCFTAEEAWMMRHGADAPSVHLRQLPSFPQAWLDPALAVKWDRIRSLRRVVTGALEIERREKRIGSSLEAMPLLYLTDAADLALFDGLDLAEIAISSSARILTDEMPADAFRLDDVPGVGVLAERADGHKCGRCWMILPEVGHAAHHDDLCQRCDQTVGGA